MPSELSSDAPKLQNQNGLNVLSSYCGQVTLCSMPHLLCYYPGPLVRGAWLSFLIECLKKSSPYTSICSILRTQTHGVLRTSPCCFPSTLCFCPSMSSRALSCLHNNMCEQISTGPNTARHAVKP